MRVSNDRWVGLFNHSKKTGAKTRPCFTGFKHPSIRLDFLHKVFVSFPVLSHNLFERFFLNSVGFVYEQFHFSTDQKELRFGL